MDLGATVCVPRKPLCTDCPLNDLCQACQLGLEQELPLQQAAKKLPLRHEVALLLERQGGYLVRRRLSSGFLGGLWEFPSIGLNDREPAEAKLPLLMADLGVTGEAQFLGSISHIYSHFRLELQIYRLSTEDLPQVAETENDWCAAAQLSDLALHGAHKKALGKLPGEIGG